MNLSYTLFSQRAAKQKLADIDSRNLLNILKNLIKDFPINFEISTNNGKCKFNKNLIYIFVPEIRNAIVNDKNLSSYHFDVEDNKNVLKRIEDLCQGKPADFFKTEVEDIKKITKFFQHQIFPMRMKDCSDLQYFSFDEDDRYLPFPDKMTIGIDYKHLYDFIFNDKWFTFNIKTKSHEYKCSPFGAYSSKVILKYLQSNPNATEYDFDFNDENSEFRSIIQYFNGKKLQINPMNMNALKQIANQLGIKSIIKSIDEYIIRYNQIIEKCEENRKLIEPYEELFDMLFHIMKKNKNEVVQFLLQSNWVKSDYKELVACILHAFKFNDHIYSHIIDLISLLNEHISSENNLSQLVPFLTKILFQQIEDHQAIATFIYLMYLKGFISIDLIINELCRKISNMPSFSIRKKTSNNMNSDITYKLEPLITFIPEIFKLHLSSTIKKSFRLALQADDDVDDDDLVEFIKEVRDGQKQNDPIINAIEIDDIDTFQSLISSYEIDITEQKTTDENGLSYIDLAAYYGSIKCFKFLFLNGAPFDTKTFSYSVCGDNVEIVRIIYQNKNKFINEEENDEEEENDNNNNDDKNKSKNPMIGVFEAAIQKHEYQIFNWLINEINLSEKDIIHLFKLSLIYGNAHSMDELIRRGIDFNNMETKDLQNIINYASSNGFYRIVKYLGSIIALEDLVEPSKRHFKEQDDVSINRKQITTFDSYLLKEAVKFCNFSIFELIFKKTAIKYSKCILDALIEAIKVDHLDAVKYILENGYYEMTPLFKNKAIITSIESNSMDVTNYLLSKDMIITPEILGAASSSGNIEFLKLLIQKADNSIDLTIPFIDAINPFSEDICRYLIELQNQLNYEVIFEYISSIARVNASIIFMMIEKCNDDRRKILIEKSLNAALRVNSTEIIEYLLATKEIDMKNLLIKAILNYSSIEIIIMILYNKYFRPEFINHVGPYGTALFVAVSQERNDIVKLLLQKKGIDPSISIDSIDTPLVEAVNKNNIEAFDMIIKFYGNDIVNQGIQIQNALSIIIDRKLYIKEEPKGFMFTPNKYREKGCLMFEKLAEISEIAPANMNENVLLYAILGKNTNLVKKLISLNLTNMKQRMRHYETFLHVAIDGPELTPIQEMIINHPDIDINASDASSETALIKAAKCNNIGLVDLIVSHPNYDPKLSLCNEAFYYATSFKELSRKFLQMKSIDVNSHIDQESTPLMGAIKSGDEELVKMIMDHPTFDPIKSKILSCLFQAVSCKNLNLFKFFLKMNGDDINIKNENNISLLCHAASVKYNIVILNEILNNEKFDQIKSDIEAAFINSKDSKTMEVLVSYDEKHDNLLTLEKIDLKMQLNPINEDTYGNENKSTNKAHQYLLRKKGIVPAIHPFCTSVVSKNLYQKLYICDTCKMERICEICAKICHKGHKIKETEYSKEQASSTGDRSSSTYKNECCCPFPFHLNNPNHKCKCKSKHISEDDENIYEDLFADKKNERNYFNSSEDDEEEVVNKNNEEDENHDFDDLRCTLDLSGFNPTLQPLYHCRKCKVDICQNCAIRCHQHHPLNYKGMSPNSICYCMNVTDCKCTERKETVCTYLFYGKEIIDQPSFRCRTCGLSRDRCCCVSCIKHCHHDHNFFSCEYSGSFCDCGYNDMVIACKAMNYPPFNYLTCCTNRDQKYDIKNQRLYHCFTCGITSKDQGICESCAIHCHIGHNVVFVGIKSFACECATMNLYKRKLNCVAYLCPEMRNTGTCSRLNSDNKNAIFGEYVCYTCDKEAKKKFCESCAVKCHKNHDVHFIKYSNFKCDCESCQCMKLDE